MFYLIVCFALCLFNKLCRAFGRPYIVLDPSPRGGWFWCVAEAPPWSKIRWQITTEGQLRFDGQYMSTDIPYSLKYFEKVIEDFREQMAGTTKAPGKFTFVIDYLYIQESVATALWECGFITRKDLRLARKGPTGILFPKTIKGVQYQIVIRVDTRYPDYDLTATFHPAKSARDRDTPSKQAVTRPQSIIKGATPPQLVAN